MRAPSSLSLVAAWVIAIAGCGGATTASTGQTSTAAGGASSAAGSGSAAAGFAGGPIGEGTAGAGGNAGWPACAAPGDCILQSVGCCGVCGTPTASDFASIDYADVDAFDHANCPNPLPCPYCPSGPWAGFAAFCQANVCDVITVATDPISACQTDDDCTLRKSECCSCGDADSSDLIAIRKDAQSTYESQVCGHGVGACVTSKCVPVVTPGLLASCDPGTHHCVASALPTCPATAPPDASPCAASLTTTCEYGADVRVSCRTELQCTGEWLYPHSDCLPVGVPGDGTCPETPPPAGTFGMSLGAVCDFGGGSSCECLQCVGPACPVGMNCQWSCSSPEPGCPAVANTGQPCPNENQTCKYGAACSETGMERTCKAGTWVDVTLLCPG